MTPRLPQTLAPQLCTPAPRAPIRDAWLHELKWDGWRILARKEGRDVRLYTRGGHEWSERLSTITAAVRALSVRSAWLDGELVHLDPNGFPDFDALRAAIHGGDQRRLHLQVFDAPWLDGRDITRRPLVERKAALERALEGAPARLRYSAHVVGDGPAFFNRVDDLGIEGIVSKRADSIYRPGERTSDWLKVKCWRTYTVVVGGIAHDADGRVEALLVGTVEGGALRYAGRVELGLGRLRALLPELRDHAVTHSPFEGEWRTRRRTWVAPRFALVVRALPRAKGRLLRHATVQRTLAVPSRVPL